ncbi:DDE superfamily endonuclease domain-containing protein [Ditylenchus destructor]|uniref:DDE superfamily endonuclease domain-containing protein n=1 Tax=Ditylenchus destructor TaxID=166010 RepID=A0AAD4MTE3_9BILA|nr:DDE superfamily endonuclease domain-containing protein [Ditylenchus destructor]
MSKRRNALSLDEKQKIIEAAEHNSNKSDLAMQLSQQFGRPIPRTTINSVLKDKEKIQDALISSADAKRARLKIAKHEDLDKAVLTWHKTVMSHPDVTVSGDLLMRFLKKWDEKMIRANRKILLVLDNCPSHPQNVQLRNIEVLFLPSNTTAESQPMDMGVIKNVKVFYRKFLLRERISAIDNNVRFEFNLLNALHLLRRSWNAVKPETIQNCFRKAGFLQAEEIENTQEDEELNHLWIEFQDKCGFTGAGLFDYIDMDRNLATAGTPTMEEIVEDIRNEQESEGESEDDIVEIEAPEPPAITSQQAQAAFQIARKYVENNTGNPSILASSDNLEEFFARERLKKMKQAKITDFNLF